MRALSCADLGRSLSLSCSLDLTSPYTHTHHNHQIINPPVLLHSPGHVLVDATWTCYQRQDGGFVRVEQRRESVFLRRACTRDRGRDAQVAALGPQLHLRTKFGVLQEWERGRCELGALLGLPPDQISTHTNPHHARLTTQ